MRPKKFYLPSRRVFAETKRGYRQIAFIFFLIILVIFSFLVWGIPLLAKMGAFLSGFGEVGTQQTSSTKNPLFPPRLEPLPTATSSAQITLRGTAEPGATVEIVMNNQTIKKVITDNEGSFAAGLELEEGENRIQTTVIGQNNQVSESAETQITYKKTPPPLEINEPTDGAILEKENKEVKFKGKTEPQAKVTINERWVIMESDGSFTANFPLSPGENVFKIVATDIAGNQAIIERKVTYNP